MRLQHIYLHFLPARHYYFVALGDISTFDLNSQYLWLFTIRFSNVSLIAIKRIAPRFWPTSKSIYRPPFLLTVVYQLYYSLFRNNK